MHIFGDESYEYFDSDESFIFAYAFVSLNIDFRKKVKTEFDRIKLILRPEIDPDTWPLHMKDLISGQKRAKLGINISKIELHSIIDDLMKILNGDQCLDRFISFFAYRTKKGNQHTPKELAFIRDSVLLHSIIGITEKITRVGFDPRFVLEAVGDAHVNEQIDPFVERVGRTCMSMLQYHYVARGRALVLPITAPKGMYLEHEVADLIAFVIRKAVVRGIVGKPSEFAIESIGEIFWGLAKPKSLWTLDCVGIPKTEWAQIEV